MKKKRMVPAQLWLAAIMAGSVPVAFSGPISSDVWYQFSFCDVGVLALGCNPADPAGDFCIPSSGTPTTFLDAPPWTFTSGVGVLLTVTDAFQSGDRFEIFDFGVSLGLTSLPGILSDCGDDPVPCLLDPSISNGSFLLASGSHSITIVPVASSGESSAYLLAASVPEPATWLSLSCGLAVLSFWVRRRRINGS